MSEESDVNEWFRLAEMDWQTAAHLYKNMYPKPREIFEGPLNELWITHYENP